MVLAVLGRARGRDGCGRYCILVNICAVPSACGGRKYNSSEPKSSRFAAATTSLGLYSHFQTEVQAMKVGLPLVLIKCAFRNWVGQSTCDLSHAFAHLLYHFALGL